MESIWELHSLRSLDSKVILNSIWQFYESSILSWYYITFGTRIHCYLLSYSQHKCNLPQCSIIIACQGLLSRKLLDKHQLMRVKKREKQLDEYSIASVYYDEIIANVVSSLILRELWNPFSSFLTCCQATNIASFDTQVQILHHFIILSHFHINY